MTTVGAGPYTYQLTQDWARLTGGEPLGLTSAVATDSHDRVFVSQWKDPPVLVFDRNGKFLTSWGAGVITDPHGLYITNDTVYLTDRRDSVALVFDLEGNLLRQIGQRGHHSDTGCENMGDLVPRAAGPFNYPTELVPAPSGDLYASDGYRNSRVHRFTSQGLLVSSWGEPGKTEPNHFHLPHSVLVAPDGVVYVCDRENSRIQRFSTDGGYLDIWTDVQRPTDIAMDRHGAFYVSELAVGGHPPRVSVFDGHGGVLSRWEARSAHGIWVDGRGDIYLAVRLANNVDKYVKDR